MKILSCSPSDALVTGTRRAETRLFVARGVAFQNGPKGNAHDVLKACQLDLLKKHIQPEKLFLGSKLTEKIQ